MTNIEVRTQNIYENLSNAEKKVASYFLDNVEHGFAKPISQLAEESGVSKVAWVRFCKAIGFDGLKDLKKSLFSELHETAGEPAEAAAFSDIREATGIDQLILSVKNNSIRAVRDTTKLLGGLGLPELLRVDQFRLTDFKGFLLGCLCRCRLFALD